ncbi:hypothetical protein CEXT_419911 [Caerostris extrusa]|uniref:Acetyl-CoA carboxylase beta subunit n=1 Tax=Caerostris extrusa TaxID=172846 RepID=A0AAV4SFI6_CAEEX|nr:hypothetical protein CEXT_419911 [Caerostris extrusa]
MGDRESSESSILPKDFGAEFWGKRTSHLGISSSILDFFLSTFSLSLSLERKEENEKKSSEEWKDSVFSVTYREPVVEDTEGP